MEERTAYWAESVHNPAGKELTPSTAQFQISQLSLRTQGPFYLDSGQAGKLLILKTSILLLHQKRKLHSFLKKKKKNLGVAPIRIA